MTEKPDVVSIAEEYYDSSHSDCESEDLKVGVSPDGFFFLK